MTRPVKAVDEGIQIMQRLCEFGNYSFQNN